MAIEIPNRLAAYGAVDSGAAPTFFRSVGFSAVVQNAVGDYTLTLDQALDALEGGVVVNPLSGGTPGFFIFQIIRPSDETIQILIGDSGGQAADADFAVTVFAFPVVDG